MKKFVVKNGIVINIIEAVDGFTIPDCDIFPYTDGGEIGHAWVNGSVVIPPPEPLVVLPEQVDKERERRIYQIATPEQRSSAMERLQQFMAENGTDVTLWPQAAQTRYNAAKAKWQQIQALDAKADLLLAMNPIPQDYTDDGYWI